MKIHGKINSAVIQVTKYRCTHGTDRQQKLREGEHAAVITSCFYVSVMADCIVFKTSNSFKALYFKDMVLLGGMVNKHNYCCQIK